MGELEEVQLQLFYYFVESEGAAANDPNEPFMLWITGGPGCSALSGLMYEIGIIPFFFLNTPCLLLLLLLHYKTIKQIDY